MNKFALAMLASVSSAEWLTWYINVNDGVGAGYVQPKSFSSASTNNWDLNLSNNNNAWLRWKKDDQLSDNSVWKPGVRGGSISYDIDVSSVGSGCVSGLYLVESSDFGCTDNPLDTTNPQCRSIDLMQANLYGFETKPHPCSNGTCDAVSQCILSVRDSLTNSGYGPGGATIDTNK